MIRKRKYLLDYLDRKSLQELQIRSVDSKTTQDREYNHTLSKIKSYTNGLVRGTLLLGLGELILQPGFSEHLNSALNTNFPTLLIDQAFVFTCGMTDFFNNYSNTKDIEELQKDKPREYLDMVRPYRNNQKK
jgi:hypothetical protein